LEQALKVGITATGTEVGKTWLGSRLAAALRGMGLQVAARKPAESFDPSERVPRDSEVLAAATGEDPGQVCPPHRRYPLAAAPPMAADELGMPAIHVHELAAEISWPPATDVVLVEGAGGIRSPLAHDGDFLDLAVAIGMDLLVVVANCHLGVISEVRTAADAIGGRFPSVAFLNHFDPSSWVASRSADWLADRFGFSVHTKVDDLAAQIRDTVARTRSS
jgi:dethiobiotin synthetase